MQGLYEVLVVIKKCTRILEFFFCVVCSAEDKPENHFNDGKCDPVSNQITTEVT